MLREELPVVRAAALAWRNGLAGLLAAMLGFSLIKGRADISSLAVSWRTAVGVLLLFALVAGIYGATRLLRAAHGRPRFIPRSAVVSKLAADRDEAGDSRAALNQGIAASFVCAALLVAAVAVTWYGPPASGPMLQAVVDGETVCGKVVRTAAGQLTLETGSGQRDISLMRIAALKPVDQCVN
ncbi:hypothetical protein [Catellatospora sp. NPDC049609]|uniref:hypothetical protein n=1 Tax=Catellatospora sp. NPDC049609 TaxID=3155505 RepID=UPI00343A1BAB